MKKILILYLLVMNLSIVAKSQNWVIKVGKMVVYEKEIKIAFEAFLFKFAMNNRVSFSQLKQFIANPEDIENENLRHVIEKLNLKNFIKSYHNTLIINEYLRRIKYKRKYKERKMLKTLNNLFSENLFFETEYSRKKIIISDKKAFKAFKMQREKDQRLKYLPLNKGTQLFKEKLYILKRREVIQQRYKELGNKYHAKINTKFLEKH